MMKGSNKEKLEWAFDVYDVDGDGEITVDEMKKVMKFIRHNAAESATTTEATARRKR